MDAALQDAIALTMMTALPFARIIWSRRVRAVTATAKPVAMIVIHAQVIVPPEMPPPAIFNVRIVQWLAASTTMPAAQVDVTPCPTMTAYPIVETTN